MYCAEIEIPHARLTAQERGRVCAKAEIPHVDSIAPERRRVCAGIEIPRVRLTAHRDANKRVERVPTATARQVAGGFKRPRSGAQESPDQALPWPRGPGESRSDSRHSSVGYRAPISGRCTGAFNPTLACDGPISGNRRHAFTN